MLDLASLKTALENAFGAGAVAGTPSSNIITMADTIATAIDTYVKSGTVNTTVTIPSTGTPGSPSVGTGVGSVT